MFAGYLLVGLGYTYSQQSSVKRTFIHLMTYITLHFETNLLGESLVLPWIFRNRRREALDSQQVKSAVLYDNLFSWGVKIE